MAIKILTKRGSEITNIDDARAYNFDAGMKSGIVKGAFGEGKIFATGNVIAIDPCELRISGHRIVIDETWSYTFNSFPASDTKYSIIAQIQVTDNDVLFSLFPQSYDIELIQDNLYLTESGIGTYQVRVCTFVLKTDGNLDDVLRNIDVISGSTGGDEGTGTQVYIDENFVEELTFKSDPQEQIDNCLKIHKEMSQPEVSTFMAPPTELPEYYTEIEVDTQLFANDTGNFHVRSKYESSDGTSYGYIFNVNHNGVYLVKTDGNYSLVETNKFASESYVDNAITSSITTVLNTEV